MPLSCLPPPSFLPDGAPWDLAVEASGRFGGTAGMAWAAGCSWCSPLGSALVDGLLGVPVPPCPVGVVGAHHLQVTGSSPERGSGATWHAWHSVTVLSVGQAPFLLQGFQKISKVFVITAGLCFSTLSIQTLPNLEPSCPVWGIKLNVHRHPVTAALPAPFIQTRLRCTDCKVMCRAHRSVSGSLRVLGQV